MISFSPFPKLETKRLSLRKLKLSDAKEVFVFRSDKTILQYISNPSAKTLQDAKAFIKMINEGIKKNEWLFWGVALKGASQLIGTACIWNIKKENFRAEIGYTLHPDFQGKGYMTEAMKTVINFGYEKLHLHSLEAHVHAKNLASIQLLKRLHFEKEGHLKENVFFNNRFHDTVIYSRIK